MAVRLPRFADAADARRFRIETEREDDGRWIAEVPALPGVLAYGATREVAIANAQALALRGLAERRGGPRTRGVVRSRVTSW